MNYTPKKWYDNSVLVIIALVVFFPVGIYALWKNNSINQALKIAVTVLFAGFFGYYFVQGAEEAVEEQQEKEMIAEAVEKHVPKAAPLLDRINREIKSIEEGKDYSGFRGSIRSLQMELILFAEWGRMVKEGMASDNEEDQKAAEELKRKASQVQAKEFPKLRAEYIKIVDEKMWENDIDVVGSGAKKEIITLIGAIYAANKNKKSTQEDIQNMLNQFRFKQSRYKWFDGDDKWTYWDIKSPKDTEVVDNM